MNEKLKTIIFVCIITAAPLTMIGFGTYLSIKRDIIEEANKFNGTGKVLIVNYIEGRAWGRCLVEVDGKRFLARIDKTYPIPGEIVKIEKDKVVEIIKGKS